VWKGTERPVVTEREFLIQIAKYQGEPIYFHGIIDEEYEDLILGEHKTFGTMPKMDILAMNMQTNLYSKAKELETGKKFKRVQWDYIRSKPATYPIWLPKSNKFSRAQNGNITPYSWERACAEKEITDEAILAQGAIFKPNIASFYFRCYTELLPGMVDSCWDNFKLLIHELIVHGDTNKMKNISRNCSWCSMRPICYAEFTGADVKYIRKTDYTIKEIEEDVKEPNEGTD
jgi:hypothetical protein